MIRRIVAPLLLLAVSTLFTQNLAAEEKKGKAKKAKSGTTAQTKKSAAKSAPKSGRIWGDPHVSVKSQKTAKSKQ